MRNVEVPKIFVDEMSSRILLAALRRPRTAVEIQRASGVPVAEVHARLAWLRRKGLVSIAAHAMDARGREVPIYQAELHNAYIFSENGRIRARFQLVACGQAEMACDAKAFL